MAVDVLDGLVSWYSFDEASGSRLDGWGRSDVALTGTVPSAAGKVGDAADFPGTTGNNLATTAPPYAGGDTSFTFAGWVRFDTLSAARSILVGRAAGSRSYFLRNDGATDGNQWRFRIDDTGGSVVNLTTGATAASTATWYFIVISHDHAANQLSLSINNGTPFTQATGGVFPRPNVNAFTFGDLEGAHDGLLDEWGCWSRLLNSDEVADLYNSGNGRALSYYAPHGRRLAEIARAAWRGASRTLLDNGGIDIINGLLSSYSYEESSGASRLDAHGQYDLADSGTVGTATGRVGTGADFSGSNALIASGGYDITGSFSLFGWFYPDVLDANYRNLISKGLSGTPGLGRNYGIAHSAGGSSNFYIQISGVSGAGSMPHEVTSTSAPTLSAWNSFGLTYDQATRTRTLYVNNVQGAQHSETTGSPTAASGSLTVGGGGSGFAGHDGRIDETLIYSRVLTSGEMTWLQNSGNGRRYADDIAPHGRRLAEIARAVWRAASRTLTSGGTPTYTASGALAITAQTLAGTATFSPGTKTASGSLTVSSATLSGSATFTGTTFTAAGALSIAAKTLAGSAAFTAPTYTAAGALAITAETLSGSATFTTPLYTAAGALAISTKTAAGTATFAPPTYAATGSLTTGSPALAGTAIFAAAVFQATGALTLAAQTLAGTATFAPPAYTAAGALTVIPQTLAGAATAAPPTYAAAGALQLSGKTIAGAATFALVRTAAGGLVKSTLTLAGTAAFAAPVYAAAGGLVKTPLVLTGVALTGGEPAPIGSISYLDARVFRNALAVAPRRNALALRRRAGT